MQHLILIRPNVACYENKHLHNQCNFIEFWVKYMFIFLNKIYKAQKKIYNFKKWRYVHVQRKEKVYDPDTFYLNPQQMLLHTRQHCQKSYSYLTSINSLIARHIPRPTSFADWSLALLPCQSSFATNITSSTSTYSKWHQNTKKQH